MSKKKKKSKKSTEDVNIANLIEALNLNSKPNAGSSSVGNQHIANLIEALNVRESSPPPRVNTQAEIERHEARRRSRLQLRPECQQTPTSKGKFKPTLPLEPRLNKVAREIAKINREMTTTLRSMNRIEKNRQKEILANKWRCQKTNVTGRMCGGPVVTRNKWSSSANKARSVVTLCKSCANVKSENGVAVGGHQGTKKSGNGSDSNGNGNVNLKMNNLTIHENWWVHPEPYRKTCR